MKITRTNKSNIPHLEYINIFNHNLLHALLGSNVSRSPFLLMRISKREKSAAMIGGVNNQYVSQLK